jgi:hypothetical protein
MAQAVHLDLHTVAMSGVNSTLISAFSVETHKLEVSPKPWERAAEIGKIPLVRLELH